MDGRKPFICTALLLLTPMDAITAQQAEHPGDANDD
jgi:hypothetical protein